MEAKLDEMTLLNLLRQRDEMAFTQLVEQYHPSLVRLARLFVQDEAVAEEISQETWLAVLQGLRHFEGRSSLKTWLFTILMNKAKTRSRRENRSLVFSDLDDSSAAFEAAPTVDPERFKHAAAGKGTDHWSTGSEPASWAGIPEDSLLSSETLDLIHQTIDRLPPNQRSVISLHDVEELSSQEICNILEISETNQRVLLHRARAKVRQVLEDYLQPEH
jgi:RNA polymerase sigma-70 factor (ECF subfamily)